jgi:hypothetical protein
LSVYSMAERQPLPPPSSFGDGFIRPTTRGRSQEFPHVGNLVGVLQGLSIMMPLLASPTPSSSVGDGCVRPASTGYLQPQAFMPMRRPFGFECSSLPPQCPKWFCSWRR